MNAKTAKLLRKVSQATSFTAKNMKRAWNRTPRNLRFKRRMELESLLIHNLL